MEHIYCLPVLRLYTGSNSRVATSPPTADIVFAAATIAFRSASVSAVSGLCGIIVITAHRTITAADKALQSFQHLYDPIPLSESHFL
jgi:hypothetical protein